MKFRARLSVMSLESRDNPSGPDLIDPTYIAPAPPTDPTTTTTTTPTDPTSTTITQTSTIPPTTTPTDPSGGVIPLIPPYSPPSP